MDDPHALVKLVMREAGYPANTECGNIQLCAGLEAGIEGATHSKGQRRLERVRAQRIVEEVESSDVQEEIETVVVGMTNLTTETAVTEEEAVKGLVGALQMEIEEEAEVDSEVKDQGDGTQRALGTIEFLTQDGVPSGTTLVDTCNGFKKLSSLAMLWNIRDHWPELARFEFNCYRHWAQLLLCQMGEHPVKILRREGVTQ